MGKKILIVYKGLKFMKEGWGPIVLMRIIMRTFNMHVRSSLSTRMNINLLWKDFSAVTDRDIAAAMSCVFKNLGNTCFVSSDQQCVHFVMHFFRTAS